MVLILRLECTHRRSQVAVPLVFLPHPNTGSARPPDKLHFIGLRTAAGSHGGNHVSERQMACAV